MHFKIQMKHQKSHANQPSLVRVSSPPKFQMALFGVARLLGVQTDLLKSESAGNMPIFVNHECKKCFWMRENMFG